jgi:glutaminase
MAEVQVFINQTFVTCENHTIASKTLFNNEWINKHSNWQQAVRNAAIAAVLQDAQVINPTDIKLITSRTKQRMASKRRYKLATGIIIIIKPSKISRTRK